MHRSMRATRWRTQARHAPMLDIDGEVPPILKKAVRPIPASHRRCSGKLEQPDRAPLDGLAQRFADISETRCDRNDETISPDDLAPAANVRTDPREARERKRPVPLPDGMEDAGNSEHDGKEIPNQDPIRK